MFNYKKLTVSKSNDSCDMFFILSFKKLVKLFTDVASRMTLVTMND